MECTVDAIQKRTNGAVLNEVLREAGFSDVFTNNYDCLLQKLVFVWLAASKIATDCGKKCVQEVFSEQIFRKMKKITGWERVSVSDQVRVYFEHDDKNFTRIDYVLTKEMFQVLYNKLNLQRDKTGMQEDWGPHPELTCKELEYDEGNFGGRDDEKRGQMQEAGADPASGALENDEVADEENTDTANVARKRMGQYLDMVIGMKAVIDRLPPNDKGLLHTPTKDDLMHPDVVKYIQTYVRAKEKGKLLLIYGCKVEYERVESFEHGTPPGGIADAVKDETVESRLDYIQDTYKKDEDLWNQEKIRIEATAVGREVPWKVVKLSHNAAALLRDMQSVWHVAKEVRMMKKRCDEDQEEHTQLEEKMMCVLHQMMTVYDEEVTNTVQNVRTATDDIPVPEREDIVKMACVSVLGVIGGRVMNSVEVPDLMATVAPSNMHDPETFTYGRMQMYAREQVVRFIERCVASNTQKEGGDDNEWEKLRSMRSRFAKHKIPMDWDFDGDIMLKDFDVMAALKKMESDYKAIESRRENEDKMVEKTIANMPHEMEGAMNAMCTFQDAIARHRDYIERICVLARKVAGKQGDGAEACASFFKPELTRLVFKTLSITFHDEMNAMNTRVGLCIGNSACDDAGATSEMGQAQGGSREDSGAGASAPGRGSGTELDLSTDYLRHMTMHGLMQAVAMTLLKQMDPTDLNLLTMGDALDAMHPFKKRGKAQTNAGVVQQYMLNSSLVDCFYKMCDIWIGLKGSIVHEDSEEKGTKELETTLATFMESRTDSEIPIIIVPSDVEEYMAKLPDIDGLDVGEFGDECLTEITLMRQKMERNYKVDCSPIKVFKRMCDGYYDRMFQTNRNMDRNLQTMKAMKSDPRNAMDVQVMSLVVKLSVVLWNYFKKEFYKYAKLVMEYQDTDEKTILNGRGLSSDDDGDEPLSQTAPGSGSGQGPQRSGSEMGSGSGMKNGAKADGKRRAPENPDVPKKRQRLALSPQQRLQKLLAISGAGRANQGFANAEYAGNAVKMGVDVNASEKEKKYVTGGSYRKPMRK